MNDEELERMASALEKFNIEIIAFQQRLSAQFKAFAQTLGEVINKEKI